MYARTPPKATVAGRRRKRKQQDHDQKAISDCPKEIGEAAAKCSPPTAGVVKNECDRTKMELLSEHYVVVEQNAAIVKENAALVGKNTVLINRVMFCLKKQNAALREEVKRLREENVALRHQIQERYCM